MKINRTALILSGIFWAILGSIPPVSLPLQWIGLIGIFVSPSRKTPRHNMGKSRNTDKYGKFKDFRKKTKKHNHKKSDYKFDEPHYQPKYNMDDTVEMPMEDLENLN